MNLVVTPSAKQVFDAELSDYKTGKGSIQLPYDRPLPADLIRRIVLHRANEYREGGVEWK